ncbi:MAG: Uncharacterised protein [Flavobacterium sp. SCGC AAA160-P02]|nr:MAG: Uncharacterised protein [Flavobacterium sp. SCGC AAA160-P02]
MKNTIGILILVIAFSFTTQAQKKHNRKQKGDFTLQQKVTLSVKKMTLELDLTEMQQLALTPILTQQFNDIRTQRKKIRKAREEMNNMDANKKYELANQLLDKRIAFRKKMKSVLNKEQFEKFTELHKKGLMGKKKRSMKNRVDRY